ncbi:MAG: adenylyltransferase/cytidyltransferase family protein [Proteobacteria bacterium]|nr:adenylyltransferase/cytidyltransferase family protein [Pseudomonadota bacterium]
MVDHPYRHKVKTAEELCAAIGKRPRKKRVIMCHGTFDVVHPGHIRHLMYARGKGDILVASLTCDAHIAKANFRPFVPEELRAMNLAALEMVDYVIIDRDPTPLKNLGMIQPDYFAKGYEYTDGGVHPRTQEEMKVLESYGGEIIFTPGDIVYSSSALIELAPPNLASDKLLAVLEAEGLTFVDLHKALDKLAGVRVHVIGDTIVDTYTQCTLIGGNTKTPTFSVRYEGKTDFVGGAAIVARHLRSAGAEVTFSTVLGDDVHKDLVLEELKKAGVTCHAVIDRTRPTTNKNAFIAGGYRLLKVDTLDNRPISDKIAGQLWEHLSSTPIDAVVFSDFRHGLFNRHTIPALITGIPEGAYRVADSQVASRWGNILDFKGFDLLTPNEREARFALGDQDVTVRPLAFELYRRAECKTLILKLGDRGLITYRQRARVDDLRSFFVVDSLADKVVDAVGSGDALLAYATLAMIATGNEVIASVLGSAAAGIECGYDGNVPVGVDSVRKNLEALEKRANYS